MIRAWPHCCWCLVSALMVAIFLSTPDLFSQPTSRSVKGLVDPCHAVRILDVQKPVDSLLITPPLRDSVTEAVLIGMVGVLVSPSDTLRAVPVGDVGKMFPVSIVSRTDSLTIISPCDLDSTYSQTTYQIVVPIVADTIIVDSLVTTRSWNGTDGGVLVLKATSAIMFNGEIDVAGLGFEGGLRSRDGGSCGQSIACDAAASPLTGGKGGSPFRPDPICRSGHRPWASGGGGGDAHNAGGGGGGNGGRGGRGGDQFRCNNVIGMWGVAGQSIVNDSLDRVFLGSGGGGGHQNNSVATNGTAGGGIVILKSPLIMGDTALISARGADAPRPAGNDGGGGGGAGGTVIIEACSTSCPLRIDVTGGRGSGSDAGHGPGGGGGGGFIIMNPAILQRDARQITAIVNGGQSGTHNGLPLSTNQAAPGERGRMLALCKTVRPHFVTIDTIAYAGDTMHIIFTAADTTSPCECVITHSIAISGAGAHALTFGTQLFTDVLLTTSTKSDSIGFQVRIPDKRSFSVPLLAVLSNDTLLQMTSSCRLDGIVVDVPCAWDGAKQTILIDACGQRIRQIALDVPFRVRVREETGRRIHVNLETSSTMRAQLHVYSSVGEQMWNQSIAWTDQSATRSTSNAFIEASNWPSGLYFIVVTTEHGTRSVLMRL